MLPGTDIANNGRSRAPGKDVVEVLDVRSGFVRSSRECQVPSSDGGLCTMPFNIAAKSTR